MNNKLLKKYLSEYKEKFDSISLEELYKWKAVKQFQTHWNLDSEKFPQMLRESLALTENLLTSGNYYPRKMIFQLAESYPDQVRAEFAHLFDESLQISPRVETFKENLKALVQNVSQGLTAYQDTRAAGAYLALRYPERYYFYKFEMFKEFCSRIQYAYIPRMGKPENIGLFIDLCDLIKQEIRKDDELLNKHWRRLDRECYTDEYLNLLTQDFIYSVTNYLAAAPETTPSGIVVGNVTIDRSVPIETKRVKSFLPNRHKIDYSKRQARNTQLGLLGELWVMQYEQKKLRAENLEKYIPEIRHVSQDEGDGLGYDIESYDDAGKPIFIEVKTTTNGLETPFFLTETELQRSIADADKYRLYRVYNFDEIKQYGDLAITTGNLTELCTRPILYQVSVKDSEA